MTIFAETTDRYAEQDALARLDYAEDWSGFMGLALGDSIATSDWSVSPAGPILYDATNSEGITSTWISGGTVGVVYRIRNLIVTAQGRQDVRYFHLLVTDGAETAGAVQTALFNRFTAVRQFKSSSVAFTSGTFPIDGLTDDDVWSNLVQAEAEASHHLRVFFAPTAILPETASQAEIDALAGAPYRLESSYDYDANSWSSDAWGFVKLHQTPVIRLDSVKFTYPSPENTVLEVPASWCRLDHKYGHLQIVPSGAMMNIGPLSSYMMQAMSSGRVIPQMMQIRYLAGLANAQRDYPDLVGLVKRMAVLKILKGGFLPQSGSISGDGLSQSMSVDSSKWQDEVDAELEHLRDTIHGIRMGFC
jgi:hypothetical protein